MRAERIARIQVKLEKYKKLMQEEEPSLQEAQNIYVSGKEESISDKEQQKYSKCCIDNLLHVHLHIYTACTV